MTKPVKVYIDRGGVFEIGPLGSFEMDEVVEIYGRPPRWRGDFAREACQAKVIRIDDDGVALAQRIA